jgi:hypothetical protein
VRILAAEVFVPEIVVGVELDEGDRAVFFRYGAENREADGMIAADADAAGSGLEDGSDSLLDALEGVFDGERVHGEVAEVGDAIFREGIYVENRIPRTDDRGLDANVAWAETRAGAIGGAAVKGDADEGDVEFFGLGDVREAHEAGNAGEAGVAESVERLRMGKAEGAAGFGHGRHISFAGGGKSTRTALGRGQRRV